jgi:hypothetical protein
MSMEALAAVRRQILEEGVDFEMCHECDDIYRFYHDEAPSGASLSEWIYHLYESEDSRLAMLTDAVRQSEGELAKTKAQMSALEGEVEHLRDRIAEYEQSPLSRFLNRLSGRHSSGRRGG